MPEFFYLSKKTICLAEANLFEWNRNNKIKGKDGIFPMMENALSKKDSGNNFFNDGRSKKENRDEIDKLIFKAVDTFLSVLIEKAAPCIFFYVTAKLLMQQLVKTTEEVLTIIRSQNNESLDSKISSATIDLHNITRFLPSNSTVTIHELDVLSNAVIDPATIREDMKELGGLEATKQSVLSLCKQLNTTSTNTRPFVPTSLLLFGPPGCGSLNFPTCWYCLRMLRLLQASPC